jgi:hypothetical protein
MSKLIRIQDRTYQKLADYGHWTDTADSIILRLLESALKKESKNRMTMDDGATST